MYVPIEATEMYVLIEATEMYVLIEATEMYVLSMYVLVASISKCMYWSRPRQKCMSGRGTYMYSVASIGTYMFCTSRYIHFCRLDVHTFLSRRQKCSVASSRYIHFCTGRSVHTFLYWSRYIHFCRLDVCTYISEPRSVHTFLSPRCMYIHVCTASRYIHVCTRSRRHF